MGNVFSRGESEGSVGEGAGVCKWLRMKFSLLAVYNDRQQRRPAATSSIAKHMMFLSRISNSGTCFASRTNTQMNVWSNTTRAYYKGFAGAKPASAPIGKEVE